MSSLGSFNYSKFRVCNLSILFILLFGFSQISIAQVKIGENPGVIDPTSILEMESDSLVMVLPRMTTADRSLIPNPYPSAMIYNTDLNCVEVNVGSKATPDWQCLADDDDIGSTGHNITFEINSTQDSIKITDAGGTLAVLMSDLVGALNNEGGLISDSSLNVDWSNITNMPSEIQDSDQYIHSSSSYDQGNEELDVVMNNISGGNFSIDLSDLATDNQLADTATTLRNLINASDAADLDMDPTNEYNTTFEINGGADSISITDGGGVKSIDLGDLVTAMDDDGLATDDQLSDTAQAIRNYIDAEVTASSGTDLDQVTGNEYNTDMSISGSGTNDSITVTDPGGVEGVDLGDLVTAMDDDGLATDSDVTTEIGDSTSVIRGLINSNAAADNDGDPTNEHNSDLTINGSGTGDSLSVVDGGSTQSVDLGDLVTAMDDDGLATDTELSDSTSQIRSDVTTEIGDTSSVLRDLITQSNAADLDTDPTNEHNSDLTINGSGTGDSLSVVDGGSTQSVDLGDLVTAMDDDGLATDTELSDSTSQIRSDVTTEIGDTSSVLRDLITQSNAADLDTDPTNEHNSDLTINGSGTGDSLSVVDGGSTQSVDLGDLVTAMDDDGLATDTELSDSTSQIRSDVTTEIGDTSSVLRDLITQSNAADLDTDPTNEHNSDLTINGSGTGDSLSVVDGGSTQSVDLGDLVTAMDDDGLATDSELSASDAADGDMSSSNEINTAFEINSIGDSLSITDSGGTLSIALSELVDSMSNHGLATDTELIDSLSDIRTHIDTTENHLGILDQMLTGDRVIDTDGNDLRITGSGRVGIGDVAIPTNSKLFVDGLISSSSDRRLKKDIMSLDYGLEEVLALDAVAYIWKDKEKAEMEGRHLGFIAQDVQKVMPELVRGEEGDNTYLSLTYDRLTPVLVNAIKELQKQLEETQKELVQTKEENRKLVSKQNHVDADFARLSSEIAQIKKLLGMEKGEEKELGEE